MTQSELILCSFSVSLIALGFVLWKYKSGKWTVGYCSNYSGFFFNVSSAQNCFIL